MQPDKLGASVSVAGVLLWEVWTAGRRPYRGLTNYQVKEMVCRNKFEILCPLDVDPLDTVSNYLEYVAELYAAIRLVNCGILNPMDTHSKL